MVEEILNNGNVVLRDWHKNEIEETSVPPQQLKQIYLDEMRMDDFETSFKRCKIDEEICKNDTMTGTATISLTTTPNTIKEDDTSVNMSFKMTCTPTKSTDEECTKTHGRTVNMTKDDVQSVSQTTTPTTTPTTMLITIHVGDNGNTEVDMGMNVYTTLTLTCSLINNEDDNCGVNSPITRLTCIVNDNECTTISTNMNPISSQKGQTELFTITNMTNSLITIMIPRESSVY